MNDPNGPIYWKGLYHMFFQYNPGAAVWGDMHWAHAVSPDMIHWRHLPLALAPSPDGPDADGCFTGSAVDDHGTATIIYTGVKTSAPQDATLRDGVHTFREVQCLATSSDRELRTWQKWKQPILQPPNDPRLTGFRDPFLWRDGNTWYLGVGAGFRKEGGCVLLYRSRDLREWEYLHPLAASKWTGRAAGCYGGFCRPGCDSRFGRMKPFRTCAPGISPCAMCWSAAVSRTLQSSRTPV